MLFERKVPKSLHILFDCRIFASEKETNNKNKT